MRLVYLVLEPSQHHFLQLIQYLVVQVNTEALQYTSEQAARSDSDYLCCCECQCYEFCNDILNKDAARPVFSLWCLCSKGCYEAQRPLGVGTAILQHGKELCCI